jgi:tetratricopeptide (TPR) repeat protein
VPWFPQIVDPPLVRSLIEPYLGSEQVDFDEPDEPTASQDEAPISEHSLAGVARGEGFAAASATSWSKNLPELMIGSVILAAGAALAWLPADPTPPDTTATHRVDPVITRGEPPIPESSRPSGPTQGDLPTSTLPWVEPNAASSTACQPISSRTMNRSIQRRAQAEKQGYDSLLRGDLDAARKAFCYSTRHDAPSVLALTGLVRTQLQLGDPESALYSVARLVERHPDASEAHNLLGDVLIRLGRLEDAREAWASAAGLARLSIPIAEALRRKSLAEADAAIAAAAYPRAERMLLRAIAFRPDDTEAVADLVLVLRREGKTGAAKRWLGYARRLDAMHPAPAREHYQRD